MSRVIKIKAYKYEELDQKAKDNFINYMWDMPFDYQRYDGQGNIITENDYFGDWGLEDQIEHCEANNYIFNKYGELVGHLEVQPCQNQS